ncbi:MAG: TRAP transporter small permease [Planctomycetota bacterium]|nr:TRAP transporter small permease [Planctomycetota bacterium]
MLSKIMKMADGLIKWASIALLGTMTFLVFLNVVLRYLFNSSIIVSEEVGRYMFVWMTFLGSIVALSENSHIKVDILVDRLPPGARKCTRLSVDLLMLLCCVLLSIGGWRQTIINMANPAPVSHVPIGLVYLAGLVASVVMSGMLVGRIVRKIADWKEAAA